MPLRVVEDRTVAAGRCAGLSARASRLPRGAIIGADIMETFLATTGRIFLRLLELHGIDADAFVRDGGYAPEAFGDPDARLPSSAVDVAARAAAARIASGSGP